jgi:hypothetical protein
VLQELGAQSGAAPWAIGSMLFFLAVWLAVVVWVVRRRPEDMEAQSRLPFEGDERPRAAGQPGAGREA